MKTHRKMILLAVVAALLAAAPAMAQGRGRGRGRGPGGGMGMGMGPGGDVLRGSVKQELYEYLYPIGLIRHYALDLKLTDVQVEKLRKVVTDVTKEVEQLKWDVQREAQKLTSLVEAGATKEQVYKQMDVVFKYENKIKKKHLGLLIVARDILTTEQREFLDKVKKEYRDKAGWGWGRGRGGRGGPSGPPPPRRGGPSPGF